MPKVIKPNKKHIMETEPLEPAWYEAPVYFRKIDFGKLSAGLFLLTMGLFYLAYNTGWLPISINFTLWQLWPMLLIFAGLSLISGRGWMPILAGSIITMTVLMLSAILISDQISLNEVPQTGQLTTDNICRPGIR
jgi:hypothetical protein